MLEDEEDDDVFYVLIYRSYGCVTEILFTGVNFPEEDDGIFYETVVLTEEPRNTFHAQATNGYATAQIRECGY